MERSYVVFQCNFNDASTQEYLLNPNSLHMIPLPFSRPKDPLVLLETS
jgi:hypothetical protein